MTMPPRSKYWLKVSYATKPRTWDDNAQRWGAPDAQIMELAAAPNNGTGTDLDSGVRDLTFDFDDLEKLHRASERIAAHLPFVKQKLIDWTVADPPATIVLRNRGAVQ